MSNRRQVARKRQLIFAAALLALLGAGGLLVAHVVHAQGGQSAGEAARHAALAPWQAVILGLVEGITEYLPVSSTGHLLLTQHFLGIGAQGQEKEAISAYEICIQAGAILAVLLLYFGRVRTMVGGVLGRSHTGRRLALNVLAGFLPAAVIGFLLEKHIKHFLFGIWPVSVAWLVGGVAILLVARQYAAARGEEKSPLEDLTLRQAFAVGLLQCVAMWPGVSRSLMTILGGVLVGLSVPAAVEFSFLLGLITLSAATLHDAVKYGDVMIQTFGIANPLIGFAVAGISAFAAVKWMVGYLNRHGLAVFGYYRIALAVVIIALLATGYFAH